MILLGPFRDSSNVASNTHGCTTFPSFEFGFGFSHGHNQNALVSGECVLYHEFNVYLPFSSPCPILPTRPTTSLQGCAAWLMTPSVKSISLVSPSLRAGPLRRRRDLEEFELNI